MHKMTSINSLVASEHVADLRRTADLRRRGVDNAPSDRDPAALRQTIALRVAQPDEANVVAHLAELDDAPTLAGKVLLAVADGDPIAALSLDDGRVVANPFASTTDAVALLRLREQHLRGKTRRRGWRAIFHPRLALH
jgi:hypothetical protein